jgi:hypothetical protein
VPDFLVFPGSAVQFQSDRLDIVPGSDEAKPQGRLFSHALSNGSRTTPVWSNAQAVGITVSEWHFSKVFPTMVRLPLSDVRGKSLGYIA